ncbi:hypothetical protein SK128_028384 [Halocaridina rubra]|uniref:Uncharacterized protein n=1 Tax=Halocaridina rubra TaxID=373956 RepID=A0AAN9AFH1_HALRR
MNEDCCSHSLESNFVEDIQKRNEWEKDEEDKEASPVELKIGSMEDKIVARNLQKNFRYSEVPSEKEQIFSYDKAFCDHMFLREEDEACNTTPNELISIRKSHTSGDVKEIRLKQVKEKVQFKREKKIFYQDQEKRRVSKSETSENVNVLEDVKVMDKSKDIISEDIDKIAECENNKQKETSPLEFTEVNVKILLDPVNH